MNAPMPKTDKRVDAYIAKAQPFARPLLVEIRKRVHRAVPNAEETMKWSMPFFLSDGKIVATMAAFKQHARYGIWAPKSPRFASITSKADLPSAREFAKLIKESLAREAKGSGMRVGPRRKAPPLAVPPELTAALKKHATARAAFEKLPPSHRREYARWIGEAKRPETKAKRVADAVKLIAKGKDRNWRYRA